MDIFKVSGSFSSRMYQFVFPPVMYKHGILSTLIFNIYT